MDLSEKLHRVADHYGENHQVIKMVGELGELSDISSEYLLAKMDGKDDGLLLLREKLFKEMADAKNMINQIAYLLRGEDILEQYCNQKMDRQLERIGQR